MKHPRVLLIGSQPERMIRLKRTYRSLQQLGVDVGVLAPFRKPIGRPRLLKAIVRYILLSIQIALSKAEVYHFYNVPDVIGFPLILKKGVMIYDVRSPWFSSIRESLGNVLLSRIANLIEWFLTMNADIVLTANTPLAKRAQRWGAKRVGVIPNYPPSDFGPKRSREEIRAKLQLDNSPTVLYLGKISLIEGSELLKQIILETCTKLPNVTFLIVGDGPQKPSIDHFIQKHNLTDRVVMTGWINHDEVADYINAADLCILPRKWDTFSPFTTPENITKVGEYLALQKVVIVPNMGGFVGAEFPLVSVEPEKMGQAVIERLSNPQKTIDSTRLSWDISHKRLETIYSQLGMIPK